MQNCEHSGYRATEGKQKDAEKSPNGRYIRLTSLSFDKSPGVKDKAASEGVGVKDKAASEGVPLEQKKKKLEQKKKRQGGGESGLEIQNLLLLWLAKLVVSVHCQI